LYSTNVIIFFVSTNKFQIFRILCSNCS